MSKPFSEKSAKWYTILLLQGAVFFNATSGIFGKLAAKQEFLSLNFILFYGCALLVALIYAVMWQQFLKRIPLSIAYGNNSVGIVWSVVFGVVFFGEPLRWTMIVGTIAIGCGLYLLVTSDG